MDNESKKRVVVVGGFGGVCCVGGRTIARTLALQAELENRGYDISDINFNMEELLMHDTFTGGQPTLTSMCIGAQHSVSKLLLPDDAIFDYVGDDRNNGHPFARMYGGTAPNHKRNKKAKFKNRNKSGRWMQ